MAIEKNIFHEQFKIRSSEVNPRGEAKLQSVCDLLQETAGNHALQLNFDLSHLQEKNLTWILHRLQVKIETFPSWREHITVETWPSGGDQLRAYRDFRLLEEDGTELGVALSHWLMLDIDTRKPVRMPDEILDLAPDDVEHVIPIPKNCLKKVQDYSIQKAFAVRYGDLDLNRHVNNVRYIEWMMEVLEDPGRVTDIDIEFHAECGRGDKILSAAEPQDEGTTYHKIARTRDQKLLAVGRTKKR